MNSRTLKRIERIKQRREEQLQSCAQLYREALEKDKANGLVYFDNPFPKPNRKILVQVSSEFEKLIKECLERQS